MNTLFSTIQTIRPWTSGNEKTIYKPNQQQSSNASTRLGLTKLIRYPTMEEKLNDFSQHTMKEYFFREITQIPRNLDTRATHHQSRLVSPIWILRSHELVSQPMAGAMTNVPQIFDHKLNSLFHKIFSQNKTNILSIWSESYKLLFHNIQQLKKLIFILHSS